MSVEEDHIKLLIKETVWDAVKKAREEDADRMKRAAYEGMKEYFNEHRLGPAHWVYLENALLERQKDWGSVKSVVIAFFLSAILFFLGEAAWEKATAKVLAADMRSARGDHQKHDTDLPE